uniref:Uncharacterized protein n=1 Tax=Branchiostoma floridae TaxID=7739 RepID=C3Y6U8_BRAFL|eukprot:XP_002608048.1 hypothetical protein BRAFLDRAFT_74997 [Branchiostoma floridae]
MASRSIPTPATVDEEDGRMSAAKDVIGASEVFSQLLASEASAWSREEGMGVVLADPGTSAGPWEQAPGVGGQLIQMSYWHFNTYKYKACPDIEEHSQLLQEPRVLKQARKQRSKG